MDLCIRPLSKDFANDFSSLLAGACAISIKDYNLFGLKFYAQFGYRHVRRLSCDQPDKRHAESRL